MNNLKKLLVTLMMTALICSNFSTVAFAESIIDQSGSQIQETSIAEGITDTDDATQANSDVAPATDESIEDTDIIAAGTEDTEITDTEDKVTEDIEASDEDLKDDTDNDKEEKEPAYSKSDLRFLSCLIYSEAGNQSYSAMLGVANVVLNRVKSDVYWHVKTIKDVIYDDKWSVQFAVTIKNRNGVSPLSKALKAYDTGEFSSGNQAAEQKCMDRAMKAAKAALNGENNIGSYLCFSNKSYKSYVKRHYSKYKIIDDMIYFRAE
jgi:spore germination cell wall hydrolase CwlJ-like protein